MNRSSQPSKAEDRREKGVTPRAVLLGLALLVINIYWLVYMELVRGGIWPTVMTLLFTAVSTLFVLLLANTLARRWRPRAALSRAELLTIYTMLATGSALAGVDVLQTLVSLLGRATYYASPANGWEHKLLPHLPDWLTVKDAAVMKAYYEGHSTLYTPERLLTWARPLSAWLVFILAMLITMFSINVLFRKAWVESERLQYPVVSLPIELTREDPPFLRQKPLWLGFGLAGGLDLLNGIHHLVPSAPAVNTKILFNLNEVLLTAPWNGVGWMPITLYPFAIGLGFVMPLDLVFSCWFFYLVWKLERVAVTYYNLDPTSMRASFDGPWSQEQITGVWIATLLFSLWAGRSYLARIGREVLRPTAGRGIEAMSARSAALLALLGAAGMTLFLRAAGMSLGIAVFYVTVYIGLSFYLARMRAELGPPAHDMYGAGPDVLLANTIGPNAMSTETRAALTMVYWLNRESCRSHPMPAHAEALKAASVAGIDQRRLWLVLLLAAMFGAVCAMWAVLHLAYTLGGIRFQGPSYWFADEGLVRFVNWSTAPPEVKPAQHWAMAAGGAVGFAGMAARTKWLWFPLHPVGYVVSAWWAINLFWFPLLLATILKGLILRYGGMRLYRGLLPFFLGLILGQFVVGGVWQLVGALLNTNTYAFWI